MEANGLTKYKYNVNKNCIETDTGDFIAYLNSIDGFRIANKLTVLEKGNEQLKNRFKKERDTAMNLGSQCDELVIKKQELELEIVRLEAIIKTGNCSSLKKENEQLKKELEDVKLDVKIYKNANTTFGGVYDENERLKSRIQYLETKIQRERNATNKQYEKWEKEALEEIDTLKKENAQ